MMTSQWRGVEIRRQKLMELLKEYIQSNLEKDGKLSEDWRMSIIILRIIFITHTCKKIFISNKYKYTTTTYIIREIEFYSK